MCNADYDRQSMCWSQMADIFADIKIAGHHAEGIAILCENCVQNLRSGIVHTAIVPFRELQKESSKLSMYLQIWSYG